METLPTLEKGDFIFYDHQNYHSDSKVKKGKHMYVVLHSYAHPYETYLIAPITSSIGPLPKHVSKIKKSDYPDCLYNDSYIDLSFITVADKKRFEPCKIKNSVGIRSVVPSELPKLNSKDLMDVNLKLLLVLELGDTVNAITNKILEKKLLDLKEQVINHVENIDECIEKNEHPSKEKLKEEFHQLKSKLLIKN